MKSFLRLHERCACAGSAAAPFALSGTERQYERALPFLVRHLALDLSVDFAKKAIAATATLDLERVTPDADSVLLDAVGFEIESVRRLTARAALDAEYEYDGDRLKIQGLAGQKNPRLEIRYRAQPRRGLYFLEPDAVVRDRPLQLWSQCQDEDARHWLPCHDKPHVKMTTELSVLVPAGLVALSNGELLSREPTKRGSGLVRYHFRLDKPHPSYLMSLVIGSFEVVRDRAAKLLDGRKVPIQYYVPANRKQDVERSFGQTPRMLELFSKLTGVPFPWSRYSQIVVSDFVFGGMENTTATTLYEHVLLDRRAGLDIASEDLVAHELAHQWFGDFVTCRDWSHAWLNEGFATFFEHLEREERLGRDEYDHAIRIDQDAYLAEAGSRYQRPIVCREYSEPIDLFDRHLYEKGGLVLHMLRRELGDSVFWRGVQLYLETHAHGIVETTDLQRALEKVSGHSLDRFFDQWVYRAGHPELLVKALYEDGLLTVSVKQTQKLTETALFEFDFEIEVLAKNGQLTRHKKRVNGAHDALVLSLAERPQYAAFDPELRVVGAIQFEAPGDFLRRQLEQGSSVNVRVAAADALAKKSDPPTVAALAKSLADVKESWIVRSEAARTLGKTRAPSALETLAEFTSVEHPKVRRAVAQALGAFRNEQALAALRPMAKKDASYLVEAEAARSLGKTRQKAALQPLLGMLDRGSWADVVRMGVLDGLAALRDEAAIDSVLERTRYGYPTRGRRAALGALANLGEGKRVREHLESLLDDRDPLVRGEVANALGTLGDARCRPALRRALEHELDGRVARRIRETLRDLAGNSSERKRMGDELENVRSELFELKARFAKLEFKAEAVGKPARKSPAKPKKASLRRRSERR